MTADINHEQLGTIENMVIDYLAENDIKVDEDELEYALMKVFCVE